MSESFKLECKWSDRDMERLVKVMEKMANEPREEMSSEEFERRYPRKHNSYELQRIENLRAREEGRQS